MDIRIKDIWTKAQTIGYTGDIIITGVGTITVTDGIITAFTPEEEA